MKAVKCHSFWRDLAHGLGICIPITSTFPVRCLLIQRSSFHFFVFCVFVVFFFSSCCCLFDYCLPCLPSSPSEWHMSVIHAPGHWTHQEQLRSISKPNSTTQEAPSDLSRTHANALNHFLAVNIALSQNIKTMHVVISGDQGAVLTQFLAKPTRALNLYLYIIQLNRFLYTTHWPFKGFLLQPASRFAFLGRSWTNYCPE